MSEGGMNEMMKEEREKREGKDDERERESGSRDQKEKKKLFLAQMTR